MSIKKKYIISSTKEMKELGTEIAKHILKKPLKKAFILALEGDLGSGKTTFTQGFAKGLGIKEKVLSPTFVLMKRYKKQKGNLYHIDCYRVKDVEGLNFDEIIKDPNNIVVIEWAENAKVKGDMIISFGYREEERTLTIS